MAAAAIFLVLLGVFLTNDAAFYRQTVVRVTDVTETDLGSQTGLNGLSEHAYLQEIRGVLQNGPQKGRTISFENQYFASEVQSERYRAGDQLFISYQEGENPEVTVLNVKRDAWLGLLAAVFAVCLLLTAGRQGWLTLLSLTVSCGAFYCCLKYCPTASFFAWQWTLLVVFFCVVTLLLISGFHRKTAGAILSTLLTTLLIFLIYRFSVGESNMVPYEFMPDIFADLPLKDIFLFSVISGALGAIMDIAITVHAAASEMVSASAGIRFDMLKKSLAELGGDLMGTMMNVLFFSYLSGSVSLTVLKICNGFTLGTIYRYDAVFNLTRFLLGAIGIAAAIPVSQAVSLLLFRKGCAKE